MMKSEGHASDRDTDQHTLLNLENDILTEPYMSDDD